MSERTILGMHWPNHPHRRDAELRQFLGETAPVTVLHMQARDEYARLCESGVDRLIHVRIYRQWWKEEDPRELARWAARELGYLWGDARVLVSPANEQNIEVREGPGWIDKQNASVRRAFYASIGEWNLAFWLELDRLVPERRALALWSALADGHDATPGVPDSEYQVPEIRAAMDYCDVIASHPYGKLHWQDGQRTVPGGSDQFWHMLRPWRPVGVAGAHDPGGMLAQFPGKPHFVSETGTFVHEVVAQAGPTEQAFAWMSALAVGDGVTLGITPFIWDSDPQHHQNIIAGNDKLVGQLLAMPRNRTSVPLPTAKARPQPKPEPPPQEPTMPEAIHIVRPGDTLSRIGATFGIPWRELAAANDIEAPWVIRVGQHLKLPGVKRCSPGGKPAPVPSGRAFEWVEGRADDTVHAWSSRHPVRFLIMHDPVAGSPAGLLRYLRQNDRGVSYSEVIVPGNPPQVHVLVHGADQRVGHAGYGEAVDVTTGTGYGRSREINLNDVSWGICIYKHKDDNGPFAADLYAAAVRLAAERARQFNVPVPNILSHAEVDPGRRSDPRGLDMVRFRADVAALLS